MNWTLIDQDNFNLQDLDATATATSVNIGNALAAVGAGANSTATAANVAPVTQDNTAVDVDLLNDMDLFDIA
jgi:hypothetical protein